MEKQEEFVIDYYRKQKNLFFIEVGANDGISISNTINLEKLYQWKGICVEANPVHYESLIKNRNCTCCNYALWENENIELEFWKITGYSDMLSGFKDSYDKDHLNRVLKEIKEYNQKLEKIILKTKKLSSVISENNIKKIDYISIDTEGSELQILKGIDFNRCDIKLISLEDNYNKNICNNHLKNNGYNFITRIGLDNFFEKI